ncbi:toxin-antitoxin system HicB family antitoxin [Ligilactobacillus salivarius]|uniref:toxin-antitoxin system HicB family antitoxin n=1 Tax=Ligilactobacillus salivarius TaxID=1624 RepID=UPI003F8B7B66
MDISREKVLTFRLPRAVKEKLNNIANKLEIPSMTYIKLSLYTMLNLSPFKFKSDIKLDDIISDIPRDRDGKVNLAISDELHSILKAKAKEYSITVNALILSIVLASLQSYDNVGENTSQEGLKVDLEINVYFNRN